MRNSQSREFRLTPLPQSQVAEVTKQYGGLTREELQNIYYDEPHHWVVVLAMVFNPFWSSDCDIQPAKDVKLTATQQTFGVRAVNSAFRGAMRVAQIFIFVLTFAAFVWPLTNLAHENDWMIWLAQSCLLASLVLIWVAWIRYMQRVSAGCRLVVTEWSIIHIVRQLPWRQDGRMSVQFELYASSSLQRSILAKLLHSADLEISTTDPGEPLPGWIKVRNPSLLQAVMEWWDYRKKEDASIKRLLSEERMQEARNRQKSSRAATYLPEDTQPIPTVIIPRPNI